MFHLTRPYKSTPWPLPMWLALVLRYQKPSNADLPPQEKRVKSYNHTCHNTDMTLYQKLVEPKGRLHTKAPYIIG